MQTPLPGPPPERMSVYVDGFNLYHGLHELAATKYLWLDLMQLAHELRPRNQIVSVKYFTADVVNDPGAQSRQAHYIQALQAKYPGRLSVIRGRYQPKPMQCRSCGSTWRHNEEKETDVNIALHVLRDALEHSCDSALVVSADSDLAPAVRMVKEVRPNFFLAAAFPPRRRSDELKALMPASFHIGEAKIRAAQLPINFTPDGSDVEFSRPSKWS